MTFLYDLDTFIEKRKHELPEGSYTTSLFKAGIDRILRKVGEETGEVIIAAKNKDNHELANETCDLLFHVLVMLRHQGLSLNDIDEVLRKRHANFEDK
jgi:phosphoribosyl-ATP pyrophosphohydrolase